MSEMFAQIPGALGLSEWFGYWPSFHDAEVLSLDLHRAGPSTLKIHTFEISNQVTSRGFLVCTKHVVVTFIIEEIKRAKREGVKVLKVIHGYGSSGKGGALYVGLRKSFGLRKKEAVIKDFIAGEDFSIFNDTVEVTP